ncbi:hypothetical protein BRARA_A02469 [Brassica rapa]|uniref:Uncharacterized protein n=1 Tax=Brassica campestris TaxID=3711 RepID=A0A398APW4_BRACM|nr:hypothetical protein BRARA_A02469 [Brassica rapa]
MWLWLCTFSTKLQRFRCGGTDVVVTLYFSGKAVVIYCCGRSYVVAASYFFSKAAACFLCGRIDVVGALS